MGGSVNKENPQQTISSAQYFISHTKSQQSLCHLDGHATLHDRNMQCSFPPGHRILVASQRSRRQSRHPHRVSMIMEVVVGTYEQVLVGFDVLTADDELEVTCTYLT